MTFQGDYLDNLTHVGIWGNSDYMNIEDWVEIIKESYTVSTVTASTGKADLVKEPWFSIHL